MVKLDCKLLGNSDFLLCVFVSFSVPTTMFYINVILKCLLIKNILIVENIFNVFISSRNSVDLSIWTLETDCLQLKLNHDIWQVT